ncbi:pleiotropic regulatory protein RsmS [Budviciaceae bacterium BWR-B9]|uniref:Pleiotropic regulatory protein RsmS n=1 Tax=Limnobaculum allomyrinae TaxID=2791986 RepID=A0ABS1IMG1_9GAMM|nr:MULTISPECIES: pleiotropic regulatory protein RsmS [Limnobaculum]MBK5142942.1 pleiotropic regulatory protein RsmS [Limnobaculum allomyrinae]MBV7690171.1 pleiotropic regulatory protein RsmS [Limnobaculum sp. M2-1]
MSLEQAPEEVKLAVDLIYLLESNQIDAKTVLAALKIVEQDFLRKAEQEQKQT